MQVDWLEHAEKQPKHWFTYIEFVATLLLKHFETTEVHFHSEISHLEKESRFFMSVAKMVFTPEKEPRICQDPVVFSCTIIRPTWHVKFVRRWHKICSLLSDRVYVDHAFKFCLDKNLRFNVTVIDMNLREFFGSCDLNYLMLKQPLVDFEVHFCGKHSLFKLYLVSHQGELIIVQGTRVPAQVHFETTVVSTCVIASQTVKFDSTDMVYCAHTIFSMKTTLLTIRIIKKTHKMVMLNITQTGEELYAIYYDGPGFLSKKMVVINSTGGIIQLSSFQCVIQTVENKAFSGAIISHTETTRPTTEILTNSDSVQVALFDSTCPHCDHYLHDKCNVLLNNSANATLNITIAEFSYFGKMHSKCLFGGAVFFENANEEEQKQLFSLCNKHTEQNSTSWLTTKSIFSDSAAVLMVFYAYKEYSSFSVHMNISTTLCKFQRILTCDHLVRPSLWFGYSITRVTPSPDVCTVVQVSSGFHEINEVFDREESLWLDIYPICFSCLHIDHSLFEDMPTFYQINGVLKHEYGSLF